MVYACVVHGCFNRQSKAGEVQSPKKQHFFRRFINFKYFYCTSSHLWTYRHIVLYVYGYNSKYIINT